MFAMLEEPLICTGVKKPTIKLAGWLLHIQTFSPKMQQQPESEDATYLLWVEEAGGNVSKAAREHATCKEDIEPLRKRITSAIGRRQNGIAPIPVEKQKRRLHTIAGGPSEAGMNRLAKVANEALQLLCISPVPLHRQRAHAVITETAPDGFHDAGGGGGGGEEGGGLASSGGSGAGGEGDDGHGGDGGGVASGGGCSAGGGGDGGGVGNIQLPAFSRNCALDESFEQELQAATGFDSKIFGAKFAQVSDFFGSAELAEEDAAPTATDAVWTARTTHFRVIVEQQIMHRFPVVFNIERTEKIVQDIQTFVVLVWMLNNFAEGRSRPRRTLWYEDLGAIFKKDTDVDIAVRRVSQLLEVPERRLTVLHNSRGLVHGKIAIKIQVSSSTHRIDCSQQPGGTAVPALICQQIVDTEHVSIEHLEGLQLSDCTAIVSSRSACIVHNH